MEHTTERRTPCSLTAASANQSARKSLTRTRRLAPKQKHRRDQPPTLLFANDRTRHYSVRWPACRLPRHHALPERASAARSPTPARRAAAGRRRCSGGPDPNSSPQRRLGSNPGPRHPAHRAMLAPPCSALDCSSGPALGIAGRLSLLGGRGRTSDAIIPERSGCAPAATLRSLTSTARAQIQRAAGGPLCSPEAVQRPPHSAHTTCSSHELCPQRAAPQLCCPADG